MTNQQYIDALSDCRSRMANAELHAATAPATERRAALRALFRVRDQYDTLLNAWYRSAEYE